MKKLTAEEKILESISQVRNRDIRSVLLVSEASRKYPMDCLNNGGLRMLVDYILELEKYVPPMELPFHRTWQERQKALESIK